MDKQLFTIIEDDADASTLHASPRAAETADRAENEKIKLTARFSHEAKTRLNAILGFTEILKESIEDPTLRHYLKVIRTSGDALLSLVDNGCSQAADDESRHALAVRRVGVYLTADGPDGEPDRSRTDDPENQRHPDGDTCAFSEPYTDTALYEARKDWEYLLFNGNIDSAGNVVFVVDDNEDNLALIAHTFAKENIKIFPFSSGNDVLEAIQLVTPSLILLDVIMPAMDGYEVCRRLKKNERTAPIPIIFLTSKTEPEDIDQGFKAGGVDYIAKPFRKEELLSRVKTHLTLHETQQSLKEALTAKEQLLDETLKGSIKVLIDILAMTNPEAFAQTLRVRTIAKKMAQRLGLDNAWEIEIGVLLSHLGCSVLPSEIVMKKQAGHRLTNQESSIFNTHPKAAARFISNIPRLEQVAESIQNQFADYNPTNDTDIIKDFIRIVFEYDNLIQSGNTQQQSLDEMNLKSSRYNPLVLGALEAEVRRLIDGYVVRTIPFDELRSGMILADDIRNASNLILVRRNSEISDVLLEKLKNIRYCGRTFDRVKVLVQNYTTEEQTSMVLMQ